MNRILGPQILWLADGPQSHWRHHRGCLEDRAVHRPADPRRATDHSGRGLRGRQGGRASAWQQFTKITLPMVKPPWWSRCCSAPSTPCGCSTCPTGMIGFGKYYVETVSMLAYVEATQFALWSGGGVRDHPVPVHRLCGVPLRPMLGADVIGDEEAKAISDQRKRQKALAKAAGSSRNRLASRPSRQGAHHEHDTGANEQRNSPSSTNPDGTRGTGRERSRHRRHRLHHPVLHHSVLLDGCFVAAPARGRLQHRLPAQATLATELRRGLPPQNYFAHSSLNSLIVPTTATILTLVFGILAAYALARLRSRPRASC